MRTLAIGDIHGCLNALLTLERIVPFRPEDSLITLGDYVDRGPDSRGVLDWAIQRYQRGKLIPLLGNHEIMMLQSRRNRAILSSWLEVGGRETLRSYGDDATLEEVPTEHWAFLDQAIRQWHETKSHIFVHASVFPDMPLEEQPEFKLHWEGILDEEPAHGSGKIVVCGHRAQKSGIPLNLGHAVCIDTWAYGRGWLTCLDVSTGRYWQANQQRESRAGWIDEIRVEG